MKVIKIHPNDNVAVAIETIAAGEVLEIIEEADSKMKRREPVVTLERIPAGHKIAIEPIGMDKDIIKYFFPIVRANEPIIV